MFSGRLEPEKRRYGSFASRVEKTDKMEPEGTIDAADQKKGAVLSTCPLRMMHASQHLC